MLNVGPEASWAEVLVLEATPATEETSRCTIGRVRVLVHFRITSL